jgi:tetratricopeptide (TPR) repeat protein
MLLDEFAGKVLAVEAGISEPRVGPVVTRSLPALRAYLTGRAERRRGRDDVAMGYFARAFEFDSAFALAALDLVSTTGWLLRWVIVTPFDAAPRLVAVLPGSNAARTAGDEMRFNRALEIAWRERAKLRARDQSLLLALRGERYPQPSYATEVLASLERALRTAPDRAETHHAIGHLLLYQGPAVGLTDSRERAKASFQMALALDSSYAAPLAGLLELAAFEGDTAALRRLGALYLARDSVSPVADYVRWRVAAGTGDERELRVLRARFGTLSTETLERIQTASQVAGVALQDADRAMDAIVRRATDPYERWIALFNANILALNRGRPREALRLLRLKRELERSDDALRHNACLDERFGDGDPLVGGDAVRSVPVPASGQRTSPVFGVAFCRLARGDTAGVGAAISRLERIGDERAVILDALRAGLTRRPTAGALRLRLDSMALRGCCAGPKWIGLAAAGLHERAGDDAGALRTLRAGRWLFPPQYLSTYLRDEGRLAARTGDRAGAIRAYRHYLLLRSKPEPELRPEVDRIKAELARLERGR